MNERVAQYLEKKRAEEKRNSDNPKTKMLVKMGLYDEVFYSENKPYDTSSDLWVHHDNANKKGWYIKVPIDVTEEEYKLLLKYYQNDDSEDIGEEIFGWGTAIRVVGIMLCVIGMIACLIGNVPLGIIPCGISILLIIIFTKMIKGFGTLISTVSKINKKL